MILKSPKRQRWLFRTPWSLWLMPGWPRILSRPLEQAMTDTEMADPLVAIRFADLADWWHADTDAMSMDRERYEHTAYKRILEMGSAVLRYMLADLRDRQGHWFDALVELSGDASVAA